METFGTEEQEKGGRGGRGLNDAAAALQQQQARGQEGMSNARPSMEEPYNSPSQKEDEISPLSHDMDAPCTVLYLIRTTA